MQQDHRPERRSQQPPLQDLLRPQILKGRSFRPGNEVLVLLPSNTSKLLVSWNGPYRILEKRGTAEYLADLPQRPKVFHASILKQYHRRAQVQCVQDLDEEATLEAISAPGNVGPTTTK